MSGGTRRWPAGHRLAAQARKAPRRVQLGAAALLVGIALLAWVVLQDDGGTPSSDLQEQLEAQPQRGAKTLEVVSASGLLRALAGVGYPIYWAGLREGIDYEVTRFADGRTFIRYLPQGEEPGSQRPYLTVGSYARKDALGSVTALKGEQGGLQFRPPGGGAAFTESPQATSVYLAFPGVVTQIEVYDPHPGRALGLVRSGRIDPVG